MTVTIGGREVVAFVEHSGPDDTTTAIEPLPADGATGFLSSTGSRTRVHVWGVESSRGQRIAAAYDDGDLPTGETEELNRVLNTTDD